MGELCTLRVLLRWEQAKNKELTCQLDVARGLNASLEVKCTDFQGILDDSVERFLKRR